MFSRNVAEKKEKEDRGQAMWANLVNYYLGNDVMKTRGGDGM